MSRCYRVSLKESITKTVSASDEMAHLVELQKGILSEEEMDNILKDVLKEEGWKEGEDGTYVLDSDDGEHLVWDLDESTVTASVEEDKAFEKEVVVTGGGGNEKQAQADAKKRMERQKQRVDIEAEEVQRRLRQKITKKLEENEASRKQKLNRVIRKTYEKALERKAGQMGTVQNVEKSQNGDDHEIMIRVLA
jgi:hypothetical protein